MFQNRLVNIMLIMLMALTLIGALTLVLYTQFFQQTNAHEEPTIDDVLRVSAETEEITTNLLSNNIVRTQFVVQLDNRSAKDEFTKRDFQVKNIIIQELSDLRGSDLQGSEGIRGLEEQVRLRINEVMQDGHVEKVYLKNLVIQ
ncbi:flagellar basal body-associated protein FliL [Bacillus shivajii]|uniref:flagellar basal body-associated protein FliL n=1 Tax=Bacillus shivajii TaxID=1983719 RepID=UPI001CFA960D|nr:flagellar basal body-associated protein FliL [Bacillus shivajii]UCZ51718.1 flagellar basal body-associated protein FliL [Bacillus shivajii]